MYKKNLLLLAAMVVLLSVQAVAQQISVKWGPQLKDKFGTTTYQIVGDDAEGFFTMRRNLFGDAMYLERYDNSNNLISSQKIEITPNTKSERITYENMFYLDGNLVLFANHTDKKANRSAVIAYQLTPQGQLTGKPVEVDVMEGAGSIRGGFSLVLSDDSSKVLVVHRSQKKRKQQEGFSMSLIDKNLQTVWEKDVVLDKLNKDVTLSNYMVDNKGNAYVLMTVAKEKGEKKTGEQTFNYVVMAFYADQQGAKEYKIDMPGKFITNTKFNVDKSGKLIVAGMYANNNKRPFFSKGSTDFYTAGSNNGWFSFDYYSPLVKASGVFYMRINPNTQQIEKTSMKEFEDKFVLGFGDGKNKKLTPEKKGISHLILKNMIIREDGGVLLVAEESYYVVKRSSTTNASGIGTDRTTYVYYRGPIVAVNVNPSGDIDWITAINKKQRYTTRDFLSYSVAVNKDQVYFMYNDHVKNLKINEYKKQKWMKKPQSSATVLVNLTNNGAYNKTFMFPAKERRTIFYPHFYMQTNSKIIMHSIRGRSYRFGSASM
ncbi:MAG: hypothetical protein LPJ89_02955 [Hymenobacteraceae bacterium]|nr:hypothetical protein [Hymenobacteraceae bacterium]MDX5396512.1 hypothetical protein [Hymenobacteraceae bacterium]MDX5442724.1 hypothetical protein [Hymenobacteraceae bacterium]MDX5512579.1 hypothetical protein [Hymenobacteraceae bacterium]